MANLMVYLDGACEPQNPGGTASVGVLVKQDGAVIHQYGRIIGSGPTMSNNVAEYSALLAFLAWYIETKQTALAVIHSDSKLLVCQMRGEWRVNGGLYQRTRDRALGLIQEHGLAGRLSYEWIPREENTEADKLSRDILAASGVVCRH